MQQPNQQTCMQTQAFQNQPGQGDLDNNRQRQQHLHSNSQSQTTEFNPSRQQAMAATHMGGNLSSEASAYGSNPHESQPPPSNPNLNLQACIIQQPPQQHLSVLQSTVASSQQDQQHPQNSFENMTEAESSASQLPTQRYIQDNNLAGFQQQPQLQHHQFSKGRQDLQHPQSTAQTQQIQPQMAVAVEPGGYHAQAQQFITGTDASGNQLVYTTASMAHPQHFQQNLNHHQPIQQPQMHMQQQLHHQSHQNYPLEHNQHNFQGFFGHPSQQPQAQTSVISTIPPHQASQATPVTSENVAMIPNTHNTAQQTFSANSVHFSQHQHQDQSYHAGSAQQRRQQTSASDIRSNTNQNSSSTEAATNTAYNYQIPEAAPQQQPNPPLDKTKIIQVGLILQLIASKGDLIPYSNSIITPFHSHEVPNINILLYYVVCSFNAGLHDSQAPFILVLLERLCQTAAQKGHPVFINSFTIHRLILTTVLITSKMYNDIYYTNQYIASVGGVTLQNINELERFYMSIIDWNLFISREEFDFYEHGLLAFQQSEAASAANSPQLMAMQGPPPALQQTFGPGAPATNAQQTNPSSAPTTEHQQQPSSSASSLLHPQQSQQWEQAPEHQNQHLQIHHNQHTHQPPLVQMTAPDHQNQSKQQVDLQNNDMLQQIMQYDEPQATAMTLSSSGRRGRVRVNDAMLMPAATQASQNPSTLIPSSTTQHALNYDVIPAQNMALTDRGCNSGPDVKVTIRGRQQNAPVSQLPQHHEEVHMMDQQQNKYSYQNMVHQQPHYSASRDIVEETKANGNLHPVQQTTQQYFQQHQHQQTTHNHQHLHQQIDNSQQPQPPQQMHLFQPLQPQQDQAQMQHMQTPQDVMMTGSSQQNSGAQASAMTNNICDDENTRLLQKRQHNQETSMQQQQQQEMLIMHQEQPQTQLQKEHSKNKQPEQAQAQQQKRE